MPCLTADALTTDPEGMAFLRDVLAQPASITGVSARRPAVAARRRVRQESELSERKPSVPPLAPTPAEAAA